MRLLSGLGVRSRMTSVEASADDSTVDVASGAGTWGDLTGVGDADMARIDYKRYSKKTIMSGLFNKD